MKLKSQKGSITIFVLVALLFYTAFLLLMYAANTNKFKTISEKAEILKGVYEKNVNNESIDSLYSKMTYVEDSNVKYKKDRLTFDGTDYIDTGIKLFSEENIHKDFEISFEITRWDKTNQDTVISIMEEATPYPGFKIWNVEGNVYLRAHSKANFSKTEAICLTNSINQNSLKIKIYRIYNTLYLKINDGEEIVILNYANLDHTFDIPVTFGAALNEVEQPFRFFNGELRNVEIKVYNERTYNEIKTANSYRLNGRTVFNGTNYLDTGLRLFSDENINKDFKISFILVDVGQNENQNTLINAKDEKGSPWPGFCFRYLTDSNSFQISAANTAKITTERTIRLYNKYIFTRVNNKLYFNFEGDQPVEIINFSTIAWHFNVPLTFGASLNASGAPQRYFKGSVEDISVELYD